jgi:tetratricopeptide (TPR) repeat protein
MSIATAKGLFTILSSNVRIGQERLYQLVRGAEWSYCIRDTQRQYEIGRILQQFPYPFDVLGNYYEAQYLNRKGLYEASTKLLERVYKEGPERYKARALQTFAARDEWQGKTGEALRFRVEAIKIGDPFASLEAQLGVAICKSTNGDHLGAIRHIEQFLPIVKAFYGPHPLYFDYLNSYTVELGEVGRIKEAQNVCRIVLASPFAFAYPEWRETWHDLTLRGYKSRSSVPIIKTIPRISGNVAFMSERERSEGHRRSPFDYPRGVSTIADWKKKMVKENGENDEKNLDEMSEKDLFMELMRVASNESLTYKKLRKMVDAVKKIAESKD